MRRIVKRSRDDTIITIKCKRSHSNSSSERPTCLLDMLHTILHHVSIAMLCFLDQITQNSLHVILLDEVTDARIMTTQHAWFTHWLNEPFYHTLQRATRDAFIYYRHRIDAYIVLTHTDSHQHVKTCYPNFRCDISLELTFNKGFIVHYYCWQHNTTKRSFRYNIHVDVYVLYRAARYIRVYTKVCPFKNSRRCEHLKTYDVASIKDLLIIDTKFSCKCGLRKYLFVIFNIDLERALEISELTHVFATMPLNWSAQGSWSDSI